MDKQLILLSNIQVLESEIKAKKEEVTSFCLQASNNLYSTLVAALPNHEVINNSEVYLTYNTGEYLVRDKLTGELLATLNIFFESMSVRLETSKLPHGLVTTMYAAVNGMIEDPEVAIHYQTL